MFSLFKYLLITLFILKTNTKNIHKKINHKDNTPQIIDKIKLFLTQQNYDKQKLDEILSQGRMAGYYYALDFFEIVTSLHYEYPDYLTDFIVIGRTYQNRELKAFKMGDLGFLKRK